MLPLLLLLPELPLSLPVLPPLLLPWCRSLNHASASRRCLKASTRFNSDLIHSLWHAALCSFLRAAFARDYRATVPNSFDVIHADDTITRNGGPRHTGLRFW